MPTYANKALVGFLFGFLTSLVAQVQDKTEFTDLSPLQWITVVMSALVTAGAVYMVPNRDPQADHQQDSVQPPTA